MTLVLSLRFMHSYIPTCSLVLINGIEIAGAIYVRRGRVYHYQAVTLDTDMYIAVRCRKPVNI